MPLVAHCNAQPRKLQPGWQHRGSAAAAAHCRRARAAPVACLAGGSSIDEAPLLSREYMRGSGGEQQQQHRSTLKGSGSLQGEEWRVPLPPHLHGKVPRRHWNANALAFLGDSVWELYVRRRFFYPPSRKDSYFGAVVEHVRAETQERLCKQLLAGTFLTDTERDVLRWGRNATGVTPKRLSDTSLKRETYRAATAIECLAGYLYLSDPDRLHEMMSLLGLGDAPELGGSNNSASGSD